MAQKMNWFAFAMTAARALLQYRETRRKIIFYTIIAVLAVFALGNWPLAAWLEDHPMRFLFYWAACAFLAIFLFLLGLYDFLSMMKDYKGHKEQP
jgi:drug/metabolite transporter (DMT)-like permease